MSPTPLDVSAFGVRSLSAFLKQKGINVRNIFLSGGVEKYRYRKDYLYRYDKKLIDEVIDLCKGSDLVGISLMTNYFERAIQITSEIKFATDLPVIWGGIHPTVMPEECIKYSDMVCIGIDKKYGRRAKLYGCKKYMVQKRR